LRYFEPAGAVHRRKLSSVALDLGESSSGGMGEDDIRAWKDALESSASADEARPQPAGGRGIVRRPQGGKEYRLCRSTQ